MILNKTFDTLNFKFDGAIREIDYDGVYVLFNGKDAIIGYTTKNQKARCCFLLAMYIKQGKTSFEIKQKAHFDLCGPMLDMSRGGVMRVGAIKKYIDYISALGLNMLMLYTEDVYELDGYQMFGYMRGRYSHNELKEIDEYAYEMGIELIPCIQTLGHLANYIRWGEASQFSENASVLLPGEEETYSFIEAEIKTMHSCLRSRRIHLGMDEAAGLGLGNYLKKHGMEDMLSIFNSHLKRVLKITKKYGYEPMIWGDMYFSKNGLNDYYEIDAIIPDHAIKSAPNDVELVFWDYYNSDYDYYNKKLIQYERFPNTLSFAGGVWTWDGYVPNFSYTLETMKPALKACLDHGVRDVIITMWGNGGCETDFLKAIDSVAIFSEYCYRGNDCTDEDIYHAASFIADSDQKFIDAVSAFHMGLEGSVGIGKGIFYCDPLINLLCFDIDYKKVVDTYSQSLDIIKQYKSHKYYSYYSLIFEIVKVKAELIAQIQKEYKANNIAYLKSVSEFVIPKLKLLYAEFYNIFSKNWLHNYKAFGYEVYAQRFGGILLRLDYTKDVIDKYINGELSNIEELDEKIVSGINKTWRYAKDYMNTGV